MLEKIPSEYVKKIIDDNKGLMLNGMFITFQYFYGDIKHNQQIKDMFLELMSDLMYRGELKLAYQGKFLEGTIEEQIDLFRQAWPEEYDENDPEKDIDNLWWLIGAPAGAVWIWEDGFEEWT